MRFTIHFVLLILLAVVTNANASTPLSRLKPIATEDPIKVVATTGMIADLVEQIGGDRVSVTALMGPGTDPHLYKASPGDLHSLRSADVIFYNGLHLEARFTDILDKLSNRQFIFAVSDQLDNSRLIAADGAVSAYDPHIWFDLMIWNECAYMVTDVLSGLDPANKAQYQSRLEAYSRQLTALDEKIRTEIAGLSDDSRVLITAHDAFQYFGRAYGIEVLGIQGLSTASEAGVQRINQMVSLMVDRKIAAIFVESTISDKNVRALIEGAEARGHHVTIGGELFSDAMGSMGTPEGEYLGMVQHNLRVIVQGLGAMKQTAGKVEATLHE